MKLPGNERTETGTDTIWVQWKMECDGLSKPFLLSVICGRAVAAPLGNFFFLNAESQVLPQTCWTRICLLIRLPGWQFKKWVPIPCYSCHREVGSLCHLLLNLVWLMTVLTNSMWQEGLHDLPRAGQKWPSRFLPVLLRCSRWGKPAAVWEVWAASGSREGTWIACLA